MFAVSLFAQFPVWSAAGELLGAWLALAAGHTELALAWSARPVAKGCRVEMLSVLSAHGQGWMAQPVKLLGAGG